MGPKGRKRGPKRTKSKTEKEAPSDVEEETTTALPSRPFQDIEGLPLSIDEPEYNILNNALSLKDSAVLYSSLVKSRKSYTNGNIFDLFWAKGKTKFEDDTNARDRMNKLCDCGMEIGPHSFDVRFFILKDDEIEKKRLDDKVKKKERRLAARVQREEKQKLKELKGSNNEGSSSKHADGIEKSTASNNVGEREGENKDEGDGEEEEDRDSSDSDADSEVPNREESEGISSRETSYTPKAQTPIGTENQASSTADKIREEKKTNEKLATVDTPIKSKLPTVEKKPEDKQSPDKSTTQNQDNQKPGNEKARSIGEKSLNVRSVSDKPANAKPLPPLQVQASHSNTSTNSTSSSKKETDSTASENKSQTAPKQVTPSQAPSQAPSQPPSQSPAPAQDPMQTPESQMMIANLNAIARADPSLNTLMKIVATGTARPDQIREFQGYIQRAKAMGPSPSFKQAFPNYSPSNEFGGGETPKTKKVKVVKPKKIKPEKLPKEKQLTTFQELYVDGADLVLEFSENPNVRYNLPKDCIVEKTGDEEFLISLLVVHNKDQIKRYKNRQQVKKDKLEKKELEKKEQEKIEVRNKRSRGKEVEEKEEIHEEKDKDETDKAVSDDKNNQDEGLSVQKKTGETKPDEETEISKQEEKDPDEPVPYFSAVSFKLTQVSERYDPIFLNSFNKPDEVKATMEEILKNGVRVPNYYIWYSVDAYEDESLAENLRNALHLIENPPKGKYKKRTLEENPLLSKSKKVKVE